MDNEFIYNYYDYMNNNLQKYRYKLLDFSITKNVVSMFLSIMILIITLLYVNYNYKKNRYRFINSFIEPIIIFIRDQIAKPNIGIQYIRHMPLLLTIFFFILLNNIIGIIPLFPGGNNLTGNISFTIVLGFISTFASIYYSNKYFWKNIFFPNVPYLLYPIIIPIELIGIFSKALSLIIRLFANISAGHIIVISLVSLIFIFKTLIVSPITIFFLIFIYILELLVAFLQAFIFTLLTALFIGNNANSEYH
ncbi:MAG: F0F1 ATP synthase subunit A [Bacteroides sp.]|nr:MAG: F0F1 ATP synthase subunit A [Bacteroides sp.]